MQLARNRLLLSLILVLAVALSATGAWALPSASGHRTTSTATSIHVLKPGATPVNGEPDGGTPHPLESPKKLIPLYGGSGGVKGLQWFQWIGRDWIRRLLGVS